MIKILLAYHLRRVVRYFHSSTVAKAITALAFISLFFLIGWSVYAFFSAGLTFILEDAFLRSALPFFSYEIFMFAISYLVFASALISGMVALFGSRADSWISASPRFPLLPHYIWARSFLASSWPLVVIGIPGLLAMSDAFEISGYGMLIGFLALIILSGIASCLALTLIILVTHILLLVRKNISLGLVACVVAVLFCIMSAFLFGSAARADILHIFNAYDITAVRAGIGSILETFRLFPSHAVSLILYSLQEGLYFDAGSILLALTTSAIGLYAVFSILAARYLPAWQALQETSFIASGSALKGADVGRVSHPIPAYLKGPVGAVFEKEARMMMRSPRDMLWIGFLAVLWLIQVTLNIFIARNMRRYGIPEATIPDIIQVFQVVIVVYFVSAFVLRFAFPSLAMEKKTAWIIATAPVSMEKIFIAKYAWFATLFSSIGIVAGLVNAAILGISFGSTLTLLVFIVTPTATTTAFGMSIAAMFPNFETDDPQMLSTTLPGLIYITLSLAYGTVGAWSLYLYRTHGDVSSFLLFLLASLCVGVAVFHTARKSFKSLEFSA